MGIKMRPLVLRLSSRQLFSRHQRKLGRKTSLTFWAADDVCDDVHGGHEVLFIFLKPFLGPRGPLTESPIPSHPPVCNNIPSPPFFSSFSSFCPVTLVTSIFVVGPPLARDHPEGLALANDHPSPPST